MKFRFICFWIVWSFICIFCQLYFGILFFNSTVTSHFVNRFFIVLLNCSSKFVIDYFLKIGTLIQLLSVNEVAHILLVCNHVKFLFNICYACMHLEMCVVNSQSLLYSSCSPWILNLFESNILQQFAIGSTTLFISLTKYWHIFICNLMQSSIAVCFSFLSFVHSTQAIF